MKRPEDLREVTENVLHGLTADESLKYRILQKAVQAPDKEPRRMFRVVPLLGSAMAVLLLMVVLLNGIGPADPVTPGEMTVFAAGGQDQVSASSFDAVRAGKVASVELSGSGKVTDPDLCAELAELFDGAEEAPLSAQDEKTGRLIIGLSDGSEYEFTTRGNELIADGKCAEAAAFLARLNELLP